MSRTREVLLVTAYVLLVFVVAFQAMWIRYELDQQHDNACSVSQINARLTIVNYVLLTNALIGENLMPEQEKAAIARSNEAIRDLNDACDTDVPEIPSATTA